MKRNLWLLALVAVVAILFFLLKPARKYNWEPSFYHHSEEPFGCKLFDEMATATMPKGYTYSDEEPDELLKSEGGKALLIINYDDWGLRYWDYQKIQQLEDFVSHGNKLMIVSNHFYVNYSEDKVHKKDYQEDSLKEAATNSITEDLFYLDTHSHLYFYVDNFRKELKDKQLRDTIVWTSASTEPLLICPSLIGNYFISFTEESKILAKVHKNKIYYKEEVTSFLDEKEDYYEHESDVEEDSYEEHESDVEEESYDDVESYDDEDESYEEEDVERLHRDDQEKSGTIAIIALSDSIGKGMFYVQCNPLLFTNYGVLNHEISLYLNHAMADLADCEVVRMPADKFMDTKYGGGGNSLDRQSHTSPLSYLLSQAPLRWALYTIFAAILLFVFFTARRRQRIIPVVKQPENRNLQFVRLISSIYYHQGDRHDLLKKKYTYFKDELRQALLMDIEDRSLLSSNIQTLSQLTGIEEQELKANLVNIPFFIDESNYLEKEDLMKYIDFMNDLLRKI